MSQILRLPAVIKKTGLGRTTIYHLVKSGNFPQKIQLTSRTVGFYESEIDAWLESRAAQRVGGAE